MDADEVDDTYNKQTTDNANKLIKRSELESRYFAYECVFYAEYAYVLGEILIGYLERRKWTTISLYLESVHMPMRTMNGETAWFFKLPNELYIWKKSNVL